MLVIETILLVLFGFFFNLDLTACPCRPSPS